MKFVLIAFLSILVVSLQLTVLSHLTIWGAVPNLVLAVVIALAISFRETKYNWLVLLPAFLQDLLIGRPFGLITLSCWLTFSGTRWLANFLFKRSELAALGALNVIGVLLFGVFFRGLAKLSDIFRLGEPVSLTFSLPSFIFNLFINSFLALIAFWVLEKIYHRFNIQR